IEVFFFFQAEDGMRYWSVMGVQPCALPISSASGPFTAEPPPNSMILHEIYFDGLGGGSAVKGPLAEAIGRDFGSLERWRAEFSEIGRASCRERGEGWGVGAAVTRER